MSEFKIPLVVEPDTGPFKEGFETEIKSGVNLWRAPNGTGKSFLMRVLSKFSRARLSVGDLTVNLESLGAEGVVRYGEAEMRVRAGKRPKVTGEAPATEWLPDPIATLATGDHMKGDRPAFKARLKALCGWVGIEADERALKELLGPDEEVRAIGSSVTIGDDLVELAEGVRKAMHEERRKAEKRHAKANEDLSAVRGRKEEILGDFEEETVKDLEPQTATVQANLDAARDALSEIRTRRRDRLEEKERREKLRTSHGDKPEPYAPAAFEEADEDAKEIQEWFQVIQEKLDTARKRYRGGDFAESLARVTNLMHGAEVLESHLKSVASAQRRHLDAEREKAEEAEAAIRRWEEQNRLLSEPLEIPSEKEVEAASRKVTDADETLRLHSTAERYRGLLGDLEASRKAVLATERQVEFWKDEADAVWDRLASLVNDRLDSDAVRVHGEAVEIHVDGTWRDIADDEWVSEGQRFGACYDLLLQHREGQRVVLIEGSTSVDPQRLDELGEKAIAKGIGLVMETQVDAEPGEFRVQHYPRVVA